MSAAADLSPHQKAVVVDLLACLDDADMHDVVLNSSDGVEVPACRFVLAARSKVLKRMLYGSFREATATKIHLDYTASTLTAVVKYCSHNTIIGTEECQPTAASVRQLVNLAKAADYLEIPGLLRDTEAIVTRLVYEHPLLACPVYDEADEQSTLFDTACRMIRCRPYVALAPPENDTSYELGGGVECLKSNRIVDLMKDTEIEAGELFLFECLKRWVDHAADYHQEEALQVAQECGKYFRLHYIEPEELLSAVQKSGLFPPNLIVEAICRQALQASAQRVWTIACRGKDANVDRVLVEGAGNSEVNGVYYRIRGLHKGDVYSKHEVSCGQLLVYTLSCSKREDTIESRILASKVLTHGAVHSVLTEQFTAPVFQPLLQVIHLEQPSNNPHDASPLAKMCKIEVSDGDHSISGTLAEDLTSLVLEKQIQQFSLIKVLACDKYEYDGKQQIHVTEVSFVSAHPGHRLGNPLDVSVVEDVESLKTTPDNDDGLQKFYSCYYPRDQQAKDSKIPRTGWGIEEKGVEPAPRCTWIPATSRRFGDISNSSSFDDGDQ